MSLQARGKAHAPGLTVTPKPAGPRQTLWDRHEFPTSRSLLEGKAGAGQCSFYFFLTEKLCSDASALQMTSNCAKLVGARAHSSSLHLIYARPSFRTGAGAALRVLDPSLQPRRRCCLERLGADRPAVAPAGTPKSASRGTADVNMEVRYEALAGRRGYVCATHRQANISETQCRNTNDKKKISKLKKTLFSASSKLKMCAL